MAHSTSIKPCCSCLAKLRRRRSSPLIVPQPRRFHRHHALSTDDKGTEVYQGMFGPWSIDRNDILEVYGYRAGISAAAMSLLLGTAAMATGADVPAALLNGECIVAAAGLGVSLVLIHIYVHEIKQLIQALFSVGVIGGMWLMATQSEALPVFVASNNWATLPVGPFFAAITAVAIKEGLCYGKAEAAILALLTPVWLLGHLTGSLPTEAEKVLAVGFALTFAVFAARKYTQPIKDDIGDKSVFEYASHHARIGA